MELKLYFLAPVRNIGIINALHKHGPRMRMIRRAVCGFGVRIWIKESSCGTVDEWPEDRDAFHALLGGGRRHASRWVYNVERQKSASAYRRI